MDFIGALYALIVTTLFGYIIVDLLTGKYFSTVLKFCIGFGVGYGLISLILILLQLLGFGWSWPILLTLLLAPSILYFTFKKFETITVKSLFLKTNKVFALLILFLLLFVLFEATIRPLSSWDGWSSWGMRAKAISFDGKVTIDQFQYLQTEYPLVAPLYSVFVYGVIGGENDSAILVVSWFFYMLIGAVAFLSVSKKTNNQFALFVTFLILSSQNLIRHGGRYEGGLADIVMAYFVLVIIVSLLSFIDNKSIKILALLSILLAIVSNVKNEGIFFSVVIFLVILFYLYTYRMLNRLYLLLLYLIPFFVWIFFKMSEPLPSGILGTQVHVSNTILSRLIFVEARQYLNIQNWNFGWIFIFAASIYTFAKRKLDGVFIALIFMTFSYSIIFLFSRVDPIEHATGVLDRLLLHIFPALVVYLCISVHPLLKRNRILSKFKLV